MSKTSNPKQITKIVIDEANGLTHVYMSDLSPKIVKANTTAPTNIPTKSEFSFRDESEESSVVVEKAFDEAFPEEEHPPLFCPICGGLLEERRKGNYEFIQCVSCSLAVQGCDNDDRRQHMKRHGIMLDSSLTIVLRFCVFNPVLKSNTSMICSVGVLESLQEELASPCASCWKTGNALNRTRSLNGRGVRNSQTNHEGEQNENA